MLLETKSTAAIIATKPIPANPKNNFNFFEFELREVCDSSIWDEVEGSILGIATSGISGVSG